MYLEYHDEIFVELGKETLLHEQLCINLLQLPKDSPVELKIAEIATYCDVVLDGTYSPEDVTKLCHTLYNRLRKKRGELVLEIVPSLPALPH